MFDSGLQFGAIDIGSSPPTAPICVPSLTILGSLTTGGFPGFNDIYGVSASGDYCYVTMGAESTLSVVDVSNPASISIVGTVTDVTNLGGPNQVDYDAGYCYVADSGTDGLVTVDVSTPTAPSVDGFLAITGGAWSSLKDGDYCYLAGSTGNVFTVADVSNPSSPSLEGSTSDASMNGGYDMVKDGDYCYVTGYSATAVAVVDVSTPASPSVVGSVTDATNLAGATGIAKVGDYCYVACYTGDRLTVINVANPASPSYVTALTDASYFDRAWGVVAQGDYLFVSARAAGNDRITVVDISTPTAPVIDNFLSDGGNEIFWPAFMDLDGSQLYVASDTSDMLTVVGVACRAEAPQTADSFAKTSGGIETFDVLEDDLVLWTTNRRSNIATNPTIGGTASHVQFISPYQKTYDNSGSNATIRTEVRQVTSDGTFTLQHGVPSTSWSAIVIRGASQLSQSNRWDEVGGDTDFSVSLSGGLSSNPLIVGELHYAYGVGQSVTATGSWTELHDVWSTDQGSAIYTSTTATTFSGDTFDGTEFGGKAAVIWEFSP